MAVICTAERSRGIRSSIKVPLGSAKGWGILQAPLGPKRIQATGQFDLGVDANIGLKYLAIIARGGNSALGPFRIKTQHQTHVALQAQKAAHFGVLGGYGHLINIGLGEIGVA